MEEKRFSFTPDVIGEGPNGEHLITDSLHYIQLGSQTQGTIYYTPANNKYWQGADVECAEERLQDRYLPYLRWAFDDIQVNDAGEEINVFPPSPENIALKRKELIEEAVSNNETPVMEEIYKKTSPLVLKNNKRFEDMLDKSSADEKLARRLNSSSRY